MHGFLQVAIFLPGLRIKIRESDNVACTGIKRAV
jgi:hypothetical protein